MRQYDDPVEVRRGEAEDPDQFLWRGRLWKVRAVVAHWVETGPWWQGAGTDSGPARDGAAVDLVAERELWRVEAGRGMPGRRHQRVLRRVRPVLRLDRRALAARRLPGLRGVT